MNNPTVSMVSIGLDDVVAGLKATLQNVPFAQFVSTWAGLPYRYDRKARTVSCVISGDGPTINGATWASAIVQSPATATTQSVPLRTALGLD